MSNAKGPSTKLSTEPERTILFSDAVFAIAITLLVVSLDLHRTKPVIWDDRMLAEIAAYVITFLVIGIYWVSHRRTFKRLEQYKSLSDCRETPLLWINILFLMCVAFLPIPTSDFAEFLRNPTNSSTILFYAISMIITGTVSFLLLLCVIRECENCGWRAVLSLSFTSEWKDFTLRKLSPPFVFLIAVALSFIKNEPRPHSSFSTVPLADVWIYCLIAGVLIIVINEMIISPTPVLWLSTLTAIVPAADIVLIPGTISYWWMYVSVFVSLTLCIGALYGVKEPHIPWRAEIFLGIFIGLGVGMLELLHFLFFSGIIYRLTQGDTYVLIGFILFVLLVFTLLSILSTTLFLAGQLFVVIIQRLELIRWTWSIRYLSSHIFRSTLYIVGILFRYLWRKRSVLIEKKLSRKKRNKSKQLL